MQRFWTLDVPSGVIPLVWNGMMSFGGGWFFLIASEVISVDNHTYAPARHRVVRRRRERAPA